MGVTAGGARPATGSSCRPRISRRERIGPDRIVHLVKLSAVEDVDEPVLAWLGEAYDAAA
jgi:hypothetical protein